MNWHPAGSIGSLLNIRGQSGLAMRDAAVFVSLSSPDTSIRAVDHSLGCGSGL
jgi:hypothetical protein